MIFILVRISYLVIFLYYVVLLSNMKQRTKEYILYSLLIGACVGASSHLLVIYTNCQPQPDNLGLLIMWGVSFFISFAFLGLFTTKEDYESEIAKDGWWKKDLIDQDKSE